MKWIRYIESSVLTSDAAADAVLSYARTLAQHHSADSVDVPAVGDDGSNIIVSMLVGPASQLVIEPAPDDELEPESDAFVSDMCHRIEQLQGV